MKSAVFFGILILFSFCGSAQEKVPPNPRLVGGCEDCEAVFEFGKKKLSAIDTLPDFNDEGPKILVTGVVLKEDEKTPAPGVVLYVYHTNQQGIYPKKEDEKGRHGYIRGWVKTNSKGQYSFYTLRPAAYPGQNIPQHIHAILLEPNGKYYWIEDYYFEDDKLLQESQLSPQAPRGGGSGVLRLTPENGIMVGRRDIVLGKNVPGY